MQRFPEGSLRYTERAIRTEPRRCRMAMRSFFIKFQGMLSIVDLRLGSEDFLEL